MPNLNSIQSVHHASTEQKQTSPATSYDIKVSITREDISDILDHCLEQRLLLNEPATSQLLALAEYIKPEQLSDEFCRTFVHELSDILQHTIGAETDSYEVTNLQHRMLRNILGAKLESH